MLQPSADEYQTLNSADGPIRKKEKKKSNAEAGDRVTQPAQSAAKALSAPASNASGHPQSVKRKKEKDKKLRSKQALLQQGVEGDTTNAVDCTEQIESTMGREPAIKQASEPGAAGSIAGLKSDSIGQSAPAEKRDLTEAKASKQAEIGGAADINNTDSMPGIPGASTGAMTWRELDKRKDVKRGRFSRTEKDTLLEAIKVSSRAQQVKTSPSPTQTLSLCCSLLPSFGCRPGTWDHLQG